MPDETAETQQPTLVTDNGLPQDGQDRMVENKQAVPGTIVTTPRMGEDVFHIKNSGVYAVERGREILICAPLRIKAFTRDSENTNWGCLTEHKDADGNIHENVINMSEINHDGTQLIERLRKDGLMIMPGRTPAAKLVSYITTTMPESDTRIRFTDKIGWHELIYVLPSGVIGTSSEIWRFKALADKPNKFSAKGSLETWINQVSRFCAGNSRLVLAVSMAFAAPLLVFARQENGGIHLIGGSSIGKSTALEVASSVCGKPNDYIEKWNATINAMEGIAKNHNDALLPLDEISQAVPRDVGDTAYMLGNGSGKGRANAKGEARRRVAFRTLFISSGERTLASAMAEANKEPKAGQEIRLVDLNADAGSGFGMFEELHGFENGAKLADYLKEMTTEHHGTAIIAFLEKVLADTTGLESQIREMVHDFETKNVPENAEGQIHRLARRFGLISVAGTFATSLGITGWPEDEAEKAASRCFQDWLRERDGVGNQEEARFLAFIRLYFERYGDSRFSSMDADDHRVLTHRDGFRKTTLQGTEFFVLPESFKVICGTYPWKKAARLLVQKGIIKPAKDGAPQTNHRLPDKNQKKLYHFTPMILGDANSSADSQTESSN